MADVVQPSEENTVDIGYTEVSDFNPLAADTVEKSYISFSTEPEKDIPEAIYANSGSSTGNTPPQSPPSSSTAQENPEKSSTPHSSSSSETHKKEEKKEETKTSSAAPIPDAELEKTVDQILVMYEMYYPQLFVHDRMPWSPKFKKQVTDNLIAKKLIDPTAPIQTNVVDPETQQPTLITLPLGTYFNQHNKTMDMIFSVKPEEKEALRAPLIDVLKEQDIQLTPMQRLGIAVGIQSASRLVMCLGINKQRSDDLNRFIQAHKERMEVLNEILRKEQETKRAAEEARQPSEKTEEPIAKEKKTLEKKPTLKEALKKKGKK